MTEMTWDSPISWTGEGVEATALMSSREAVLLRDWDRIARELERISMLPDGWDDLGAESPSDEVISDAFLYLWSLRERGPWNPPARVVASPAGTIVFEWQGEASLFEVEIEEPGVAEYCLRESGKSPEFGSFSLLPETARDETWDRSQEEAASAA